MDIIIPIILNSNIRLIDCINKPKDLIDKAIELGLSGIAITDHECLSAHMEVNQYAQKLKETNPDFTIALGNEIYLVDERKPGIKYWHFILIAKDAIGHRGLCELSSKAWYNSYTDRRMERVPLTKDELSEIMSNYKGHIIATTACIGGELPQLALAWDRAAANKDDKLKEHYWFRICEFVKFCQDVFSADDFYIETAPSNKSEQITANKNLKIIADELGIKITTATDSHYLTKELRYAHKSYLNSKDGDREVDDFYEFARLMDEAEVRELLSYSFDNATIEKILKTTEEIREKIEWYSLEHTSRIPQVYVVPRKGREVPTLDFHFPTLDWIDKEGNDQEQFWLDKCVFALKEKNLVKEEYYERLNTEAEVIKYIGEQLNDCLFSYFVTFEHYINTFWECGSIVGPGRGSATGFLSNYLLGITQLDPIRWNLQWWRFLNKERAELPDIDIDLAPSVRPKIFEAIRQERGELGLVQVATFGTESTKSAIQTACRGYRLLNKDGVELYPNGIDVDVAQYMSSLVPQERGFIWSMHDVLYGDAEKGRSPVTLLIDEINKYPGLLEIILNIEGLISRRGSHASGVILYDADKFFDTASLMRTPSGDLITCYDLHKAEAAGDVKYDFLVTEATDKLIQCYNLLKKDKQIPEMSLREWYDEYLHPEHIDTKDPRIWKALIDGSVLDVFQFNTPVGFAIAKKMKPQTPFEMMAASAMMRLMSEPGVESQQERYVRIRDEGIQSFDKEMKKLHLSDKLIAAMHKHCDTYYGCCAIQEQMMQILMDPDIAKFSLKEANDARKIVGKKQMSRIPELRQHIFQNMNDDIAANYVWKTAIAPSMGYAFSENHSLPYSFVGMQMIILATHFNSVYWNTACLIVNSGAIDPENGGSTKYDKIAKAIGDIRESGIKISLPDINKSDFGFIPDKDNSQILFGLKGMLNVGDDLIQDIINNRPYSSMWDFFNKVSPNRQAMISLIKGGAFDNFGDRHKLMAEYLWMTADKKKRINLTTMNIMLQKGLIPDALSFERKVFEFNRYLKNECKFNSDLYKLDERAINFLDKYFRDSILIGEVLSVKTWDKVYQKAMDPVRDWMKNNQSEMLYQLNKQIFKDDWDKYAKGTYSSWEMEVLCFYYHDHELKNVNKSSYGISNFKNLPETPIIERTYRNYPIYRLNRICGTCIAKDKVRSTISLLTVDGVVNVKLRDQYFAIYNKQISQIGADGKKHVIEKSWFNRGSMLMVTGYRNGDNFVAKKYSNTVGHQLYKIEEVNNETGKIILKMERAQGEAEDVA